MKHFSAGKINSSGRGRAWAAKKLVLRRFRFAQVSFPDSLHVRPGLVPVGHRFGVLERVALLDLCSPRPASGRGAGGEGEKCRKQWLSSRLGVTPLVIMIRTRGGAGTQRGDRSVSPALRSSANSAVQSSYSQDSSNSWLFPKGY